MISHHCSGPCCFRSVLLPLSLSLSVVKHLVMFPCSFMIYGSLLGSCCCCSSRSSFFCSRGISVLFQGNLIDKPNSEQLVIALEPEAASLHCRHLPDTDFVGYKDNSIKKPTFEPGTKYLVVDAGGTEPFPSRCQQLFSSCHHRHNHHRHQ